MNQNKKSQVYLVDGSAAKPSLTFGIDPDTGMFRVGSGTVGFTADGAEVFRIGSSGTFTVASLIEQVNNLIALGMIYANNISVKGSLTAGLVSSDEKANLNNTDLFGDTRINNNATVTGNIVVNNGTTLHADITDNTPVLTIVADAKNAYENYLIHATADANGGGIAIGKSRATTLNGVATIVQNNDSLGAVEFHGADGADYISAADIKVAVDGTPGVADMPGRLVFSTTADGASSSTERLRIASNGLATFANNTRVNGNVGLGTDTYGTNAVSVLGLFNGTVPATSPADTVQLFSTDISAGNASLGIRTETAVATEAALASTHTLSVTINGAVYRVLLTNA